MSNHITQIILQMKSTTRYQIMHYLHRNFNVTKNMQYHTIDNQKWNYGLTMFMEPAHGIVGDLRINAFSRSRSAIFLFQTLCLEIISQYYSNQG